MQTVSLVKRHCSNLTPEVSSFSNHHFSNNPSKSNSRMKQDFFTYLPTEITTNILSRLPIRSIAISKCVCKSWLHLLKTDEFVNSHIAKSVPGLAVLMPERDSCLCTVFEFEDGPDLEHRDLHYSPLTEFDFSRFAMIQGSANGLLLLYKRAVHIHPEALYVCNPITRDYIELHCPKEFEFMHPQVVTFGFGASKLTGEHKVVRIFNDLINAKCECHVHTLGTGSWRSIEPCAPFKYKAPCKVNALIYGAFLNGNLHWIVSDSNCTTWISCFDLETEHFSTFSMPLRSRKYLSGLFLSALGDHLCLCDGSSEDELEIVIWLMKEYGVEKSWTKQFAVSQNPEFDWEGWEHVYPIKVFGDGGILMLWEGKFLFYYSSKTKTTEEISRFEHEEVDSILLTPSFLSLRNLGLENVLSF